MTKRSGFTLIELLVVIAIIAILAAMLFPVFARARESARKIQCLSNVKNIATAIQMYLTDYDSFPPALSGSAFNNVKPLLDVGCETDTCIGAAFHSNPYLRWAVVLDEYVRNREVWNCPSAKLADVFVINFDPGGPDGWAHWMAAHRGTGLGSLARPTSRLAGVAASPIQPFRTAKFRIWIAKARRVPRDNSAAASVSWKKTTAERRSPRLTTRPRSWSAVTARRTACAVRYATYSTCVGLGTGSRGAAQPIRAIVRGVYSVVSTLHTSGSSGPTLHFASSTPGTWAASTWGSPTVTPPGIAQTRS